MKPLVSILTALCLLTPALAIPSRAGVTVFDALANTHPDFQVTVTGQGRPVIFIPGLATPGSIWQPAVDQLKATCECHVLTFAGFGGADERTPFEAGSTTKAMTGMLLADMAEDGVVALDDPVGEHVAGTPPGSGAATLAERTPAAAMPAKAAARAAQARNGARCPRSSPAVPPMPTARMIVNSSEGSRAAAK